MRKKKWIACARLMCLCLAYSGVASAEGFVEKYERMLTELGISAGPIDDVLDGEAQAAISEFQKFNGLDISGLLDNQTQQAIEQAYQRKFGPAVISQPPAIEPVYQPRAPQQPPSYSTASEYQPTAAPVQPVQAKTNTNAGRKPEQASNIPPIQTPHRQHYSLRTAFAYTIAATALDDGRNEATASTSSVAISALFQTHTGFFAGFAAGDVTLEEIEVNNVTTDLDESADLFAYTLGWRGTAVNNPELYWGLSYSHSRIDSSGNNSNEDSTSEIGIFTEKDTPRRYGRVTAGLSFNDVADLLTIKGTHIWFPGRDIFGLGLDWSLATGETDNNADVAAFGIGAKLMLRF